MTYPGWWALALSESVKSDKGHAVVCEGAQIALFRDATGAVFALEDRCAHRRVLLSPGPVVAGGLQCPYHGWTFDGASGQCTDIPNLRRDEPIGEKYAVRAYPAREAHGFVHVWRGGGEPDARLPSAGTAPRGREYTGSAVVSLALSHYLDVMLDGPESLLSFAGVQITDFFLGDPRREDGYLLLDRGAVWQGRGAGPAFVRDHPLLVRTRVPLVGGTMTVTLLSAEEDELVTVVIAASENRRGTTSLCWRGFRHAQARPGMPLKARLAQALGRAPFEVFAQIDGAAIAALEVAPSLERQGASFDRQRKLA